VSQKRSQALGWGCADGLTGRKNCPEALGRHPGPLFSFPRSVGGWSGLKFVGGGGGGGAPSRGRGGGGSGDGGRGAGREWEGEVLFLVPGSSREGDIS